MGFTSHKGALFLFLFYKRSTLFFFNFVGGFFTKQRSSSLRAPKCFGIPKQRAYYILLHPVPEKPVAFLLL